MNNEGLDLGDIVVRRKRKRCSGNDDCPLCYVEPVHSMESSTFAKLQVIKPVLGAKFSEALYPASETSLPVGAISMQTVTPSRNASNTQPIYDAVTPKEDRAIAPNNNGTKDLITVDDFLRQCTTSTRAKKAKTYKLRRINLTNQDNSADTSSETGPASSSPLARSSKGRCMRKFGNAKSKGLAQRLIDAVVMTRGEPSDELAQLGSGGDDPMNTRVPLCLVTENPSSLKSSKLGKWSLVDPRKVATPFPASAFRNRGDRNLTGSTLTLYETVASRGLKDVMEAGSADCAAQHSSSPCAKRQKVKNQVRFYEPPALDLVPVKITDESANKNKKRMRQSPIKTRSSKKKMDTRDMVDEQAAVHCKPLDVASVPTRTKGLSGGDKNGYSVSQLDEALRRVTSNVEGLSASFSKDVDAERKAFLCNNIIMLISTGDAKHDHMEGNAKQTADDLTTALFSENTFNIDHVPRIPHASSLHTGKSRVLPFTRPLSHPLFYLLNPNSGPTATRVPVQPSSDDENQPALVRYARLKQKEQANAVSLATRPGGPRIISTPPNPERWAVKDTTVNVATAFSQAANASVPDIIGMQTTNSNYTWASGSSRPNPTVPRSTSVEYEKETQSTSLRNRLAPPPSRIAQNAGAGIRTTVGTRKPPSKTASIRHVPDSEGEGENDADISGRAKSPFNQVIDVAKRALAPATFYLRQRSQEPEGPGAADRSNVSATSNTNGKNSSYDYSAEEREFQANRPSAKANSSITHTHRKNRMSVDNKAYKPSISDEEGSEEYTDDDGKSRRRRKKKKKNETVGGPLTTLPVMAADKRKRRKSRGSKGGTGVDVDDEGSESDGNTTAPEKQSNLSRASVAKSSIPPLSRVSTRGSVPPESHRSTNVGDISLDDAEQGLHSIPEVEVEDEEDIVYDDTSNQTLSPQSPSFSVGAFLGRLVHICIKSCLSLFILIVRLLSGLFFIIGRVLGIMVETVLVRPLRILGLVRSMPRSTSQQNASAHDTYTDTARTPVNLEYSSSQSTSPKPIGKYLLIALSILAASYALREPGELPSFSIPLPTSIPLTLPIPLFSGKGKSRHDQVYIAPDAVPANFAELAARLQTIENAMSELSRDAGDRAINHDDLLNRLDDLADRVSREMRERKRLLDSVEGRVRDGVEGAVRRVEETVERRVEGAERKMDKKVEESVQNKAKEVEKKVVGGEIGNMRREMEILRAKLASAVISGKRDGTSGRDEEARTKLRALEERLGEIEGGVQEAIELGKKAGSALPSTSVPSSASPWWTKFSPSKALPSDITIKSSDGQDIMGLLNQMITTSVLTHLHKDAIARPDYALYSAGARVIPSLTSQTLELRPPTLGSRFLGFVSGHGYAMGRPPVTALHHEVQNGFCWPFAGSKGQLGVSLAAVVLVDSVTIDHVPKEVAFDVRSAPKDMEVWGLVEGEDNIRKVKEWRERKASEREQRRQQQSEGKGQGEEQEVEQEEVEYPPTLPKFPGYIRLANFTYDIEGGSHVQTFPVSDEVREMGVDFAVMVLMVKDNWGREDLTCLYRFRVHGTKAEPAGEQEVEGEVLQ
ncbi:hypothetical protein AX17_006387 [Amanita inopinata Kibby_2008]|nr:hypothetical protein AX17_006387 [Amanita inopinata Kibby_2008]